MSDIKASHPKPACHPATYASFHQRLLSVFSVPARLWMLGTHWSPGEFSQRASPTKEETALQTKHSGFIAMLPSQKTSFRGAMGGKRQWRPSGWHPGRSEEVEPTDVSQRTK